MCRCKIRQIIDEINRKSSYIQERFHNLTRTACADSKTAVNYRCAGARKKKLEKYAKAAISYNQEKIEIRFIKILHICVNLKRKKYVVGHEIEKTLNFEKYVLEKCETD